MQSRVILLVCALMGLGLVVGVAPTLLAQTPPPINECVGTTYDGKHICHLTTAQVNSLRTPTPTPSPPPRPSISNPNGNCIEVFNQANRVIENVDIGPCGGHGIAVYASSNVTIRNVRILVRPPTFGWNKCSSRDLAACVI